MRGYSLHDLYAKVLALLGLGMLAGTGALVDYWPSEGGNLPVPEVPSVSLPAPVMTLASGGANAVQAIPAPARFPRTAPSPAAPVVKASLVFPPAAPMALAPSESLGVHVPLPVLELTVIPAMLEHAQVVFEPVALADAEETQPVAYALLEHQGAPVSRTIDESDRGGFISGAFRKTSDSLRKTGVKTGSSIVGVIRGVGGAVRRALPVI